MQPRKYVLKFISLLVSLKEIVNFLLGFIELHTILAWIM